MFPRSKEIKLLLSGFDKQLLILTTRFEIYHEILKGCLQIPLSH
jgi:hypothetical protein